MEIGFLLICGVCAIIFLQVKFYGWSFSTSLLPRAAGRREHEEEREQEIKNCVEEPVQRGPSGPVLTRLWPRDDTTGDTTIDIVAIHGLDTQSPKTWKAYRNRKDKTGGLVHWLDDEDMLHSIFPEARIFTYDWLSRTYHDAVDDELVGHAKTFLHELKRRNSPNQHLIFIASCFGGLLLAKAMTLASDKSSEYHKILDHRIGILFLGTPFRKSDAGTAAQVRVQVAKAMGGESSGNLVRYLRRYNNELNEMVAFFEQILRYRNDNIWLRCYYETKKSNISYAIFPQAIANFIPWGKLILVPKDSACIGGFPSEPLPVKHGLLNKFFGPEDTNFKTVCNGLKDLIDKTKLSDIDVMLKHYYSYNDGKRLRIERLSGHFLPMEKCYINLCIVDRDREYNAKATDTKSQGSAVSHQLSKFSLSSRLKVETPPETKQINLQTLFEPRRRPNGTTARPNRVLIWGAAGVGKSTLCKKIVHDFIHKRLWEDLFDRVFWLPLRELKPDSRKSEDLVDFILKKFFVGTGNHKFLGKKLRNMTGKHGDRQHDRYDNRTLFILDGLDEVSHAIGPDDAMRCVLDELLEQGNTIITSRQHSTTLLQDTPPDLELETVGFFPAQVEEYLENEREQTGASDETMSEIRSFIRNHPVVQSLVRIPIQLDAICYSWGSNLFPNKDVTMTVLYTKIELKLWEKYITWRDRLVNSQIQNSIAVKRLANRGEIEFLGKLAFSGLYKDIIEFNAEHIGEAETDQKPMLNNDLVNMPFLRSSNISWMSTDPSYHFIHLTFQEYFAARHFVRHWTSDEKVSVPKKKSRSQKSAENRELISPRKFLLREKYNARFDVFWRFVVGLLREEDSKQLQEFFEELESEPRDLLGPAHQRLVAHCLNELGTADNDFGSTVEEMQDKYLQWMLFERRVNSSPYLGLERECPDRIFTSLLQGTPEMRLVGMSSLENWLNIPSDILDLVLYELRTSFDTDMRQIAYRLLGNHCNQGSKQQYIDFWQDLAKSDLNRRLEAIHALTVSTQLQQSAVDALVRLLEDKDKEVRYQAARALGMQTQLPEVVVNGLTQRLQDENEDVRFQAVVALDSQRQLSSAVVEGLVQLLENGDEKIQSQAASVLYSQISLPSTILKGLVEMLKDEKKEEKTREHASFVLYGQSHLPDTIVDELIPLLEEEHKGPRSHALKALSRQKELPETVIKGLIQSLKDKNDDVRFRAVDTLSRQGQLPEAAVEGLVKLLKVKDIVTQWRVADALGGQSQLPVAVVESIVQLLDNKDEKHIVMALGGQDQLSDAAIKVLVRLLQDDDISVYSRAATVLGRQIELSQSTLKVLLELAPRGKRSRKVGRILNRGEALHRLIPTLTFPLIKNLLLIWLRESFESFTTCFIADEHLFIHIDGKSETIPLEKGQAEAFRRAQLEIQEHFGFTSSLL